MPFARQRGVPIADARTFVDVLRARAESAPEETAFVFLPEGEDAELSLTYSQLDRRAQACAGRLHQRFQPGARALLAFPSGLDFIAAFFGCLYAGLIAVPAPLPRLSRVRRSYARLEAIAANARPTVALAAPADIASLAENLRREPAFSGIEWLAASEALDHSAPRCQLADYEPATLAFLQYTSGSTGVPRGVKITHRNLLHNQQLLQQAFAHDANSIVCGWLPMFHDMGLVGNILHPVYMGIPSVLMPPLAFLQQPLRWLRAISKYRATTSGGPDFAYAHCVKKITAEDRAAEVRAGLDLSCWTAAFNGAEPVRSSTLVEFARTFADCGFRTSSFLPCYGLAEATLIVSGGRVACGPVIESFDSEALGNNRVSPSDGSDTTALVGCGAILGAQHIAIVDPETGALAGENRVGEILVSGPSVSAGYWNSPDSDSSAFEATLHAPATERFLRTGDLGFVEDGQLFIAGRMKDLIIVRGRNYYPQDLELTAETACPGARYGGAAAFQVERGRAEGFVLVQEMQRGWRPEAAQTAIASIRDAIATAHDVTPQEIVLVRAHTLPRTSSGKLQRHAVRAAWLAGALRSLAISQLTSVERELDQVDRASLLALPRPERKAALRNAIRMLVAAALRVAPGANAEDQPLPALGLDSLAAVQIAHRLETMLGVQIGVAEIFNFATIEGLATVVEDRLAALPEARAQVPSALVSVDKERSEYPATRGQRALLYLQQLDPASAAYNIARAVSIDGDLDSGALKNAFSALQHRHAALRTVFVSANGEPAQRVLPDLQPEFQEWNAQAWSEEQITAALDEQAHRPFDLARGPMLRVTLLRLRENRSLLLVAAHHIAADFWSLRILWREFISLYHAAVTGISAVLEPLPFTYGDYALRERERLASAEQDALWSYWRTQLAAPLPVLNLPLDRARPEVQTFHGASVSWTLSGESLNRLQTIAAEESATLFVSLLCVFQILLARYASQEEVIVGCPELGRQSPETAALIGYFVNPLPIRTSLAANPSFRSLLRQVRRTVLEAFEHAALPFEFITERLGQARDASRTPIFQALFVLQDAGPAEADLLPLALNEEGPAIPAGDLLVRPFPIPQRSAQFDLTLVTGRLNDGLSGSLQYNTDLFEASIIRRLGEHLHALVEALTARPGEPVLDQPILTPQERQQILHGWNATHCEFAFGTKLLHELFTAQAQLSPREIAVSFGDSSLTYAELDRSSSLFAAQLCGAGAIPGSVIAICVERSLEMMTGFLGILKSGAAYLPIDASYPPERIQTILEDAQPQILVVHAATRNVGALSSGRVFDLNAGTNPSGLQAAPYLPHAAPDDLAYVIYTSGSTGKPKGVMIPHRGIVNRLLWMQQAYRLTPLDRVLQKTSISFDVSVWELFWPLIAGATLVVAGPDDHRNPHRLAGLIETNRITVAHFVPSMLRAFLDHGGTAGCQSLRLIVSSGEALTSALVQNFHRKFQARFENLYGPTEASVDVTSWTAAPADSAAVPIGRPIANTQTYVVDARMQPVPFGIPGELLIGGVQLARGYLGRPDLTAERFIPNPFSSAPGERLYRTGDLARYRENGDLEFQGRADRQVKIRGNRVELAEVESALLRHARVKEVAVVASGERDTSRLTAFVVAREPNLAAAELRQFAATHLPSFMVPASFTFLERLPLNASGKLDLRALPEPGRDRREHVPPSTATQELLASVFANVLGVLQVGITDNFFELGGDSLRAIEVSARAREKGVELPLSDILRFQTIRELASHVELNATPVRPAPERPRFALLSASDQARLLQNLEENLEDAFPMSVLQQGLFFHSEFGADYESYVTSVHVRSSFDAGAFDAALARVLARHPILRTSFDLTNGSEPLQLVHRHAALRVAVEDLAELSEPARLAHLAAWMDREKTRKFDWSRPPLLRVTAHLRSPGTFQLTICEPFFDGWSAASLVSELLRTYAALLANPANPDAPLEAPLNATFADFVALERDAMASPECRDFWDSMLEGCTYHRIPSWGRRETAGPVTRRVRLDVQPEVVQGLKDLCRSANVPLKSVVLAAHIKAMTVFSGPDVLTGVIANGRPEQTDGDKVLGVHLNAVPFRINRVAGSWTQLVKAVFDAERAMLPYRRYPIAELQRQRGRQALFEAVFNFTHFRAYKQIQQSSDMEILDGYASEQTYFPLTVHLNVDHASGYLLLALDYNSRLFSAEQVASYAAWHLRVLETMAARPQENSERLCVLTPAEQEQSIRAWNRTEISVPHACLHERLEQQSRLTPDAIALVYKSQRLTYADLHARANRLARYLRDHAVGLESRVGICLDRSVTMVLSMLAVLKAGGAYVPLDPAYPAERLRFIVEDAGMNLVLTQRSVRHRLPEGVRAVSIEEETARIDAYPSHSLRSSVRPENAAYVLYTSGSTGRPKGAVIEHRNSTAFLDWVLAEFKQEWLAKVLFGSSICFDMSVLELFAPLLCGGAAVLAENVLSLPGMPEAAGVTLLSTVPSAITELMRLRAVPESAKTIALAGEPLQQALVDKIYQNTAAERVYNLYGLTELTTYSTFAMLPPGAPHASIGLPVFNTTAYVLDALGDPLPTGVPGELYIGGDLVSRCYHNRPDLTAARYVPDPFSSKPGARLYRTGDHVRRMLDGTLDLLGRLDHQVKIRGFRVEPGETESVLTRHPKVSATLVMARAGKESNDARLTAYIVPAANAALTARELREFLAQHVPAHQVPSDFVFLEEFPLTPNGKLNRLALPEPGEERPAMRSACVRPRDEVEAEVAAVWEEIIQRTGVGVFDDFFELGGHSLLATQVVARLRRHFQVELPLPALFEAPTVAALADLIRTQRQSVDIENLDALLDEVESLSESEVQERLQHLTSAGMGL